MGLINLDYASRTTTGKNANRRTRAAGKIPAVLYGHDRETIMVELDAHEFKIAMSKGAGQSSIFALGKGDNIDEKPIALLREVQRNPVTDQVLHVDLMEIPRGVPVTVAVSVRVVGSCAAVKSGEASVAMSMSSIDLSCRPSQVPDELEIDISELNINDKVFVKDVQAPVGEIVSDPEGLVLNIKAASIILEEEVVEGEEGAEGAEGEAGDDEKDKDD